MLGNTQTLKLSSCRNRYNKQTTYMFLMRMIRPKYFNIFKKMHIGYKEKKTMLQERLAYLVYKEHSNLIDHILLYCTILNLNKKGGKLLTKLKYFFPDLCWLRKPFFFSFSPRKLSPHINSITKQHSAVPSSKHKTKSSG